MDTAGNTPADVAAPILLEGADVLALLNRISTQRLDDLEPGAARMTIFCSPRGGMRHRAAVARVGDRVWLLRDDAPAASLSVHVDRHVFRERVKLVAPPPGLAVRAVFGGFGLPAGTLEDRDGVPVRVQVEEAFGYAVGAGATSDPRAGAESADAENTRILAGWPRHDREVVEDLSPYDIGRAHEVHLAKGCYTGQESLLRLITYGGLRRGLARLEGDGVVPAAPAPLTAGGAEIGRLTSAAVHGDGWIGLAVLRRDAIDSGADVSLGGGRTARLAAVFADTHPVGLPR